MAVYKCKMCGGDLNIEPGVSVVECEYCGSKQTVPTADNEKKMGLFARAEKLRAGNEFDKAAAIYEQIVAEFPTESEAYWGLFLCHFGIEYVDDPGTGKKIPTCHRSSFDSAMDDQNFELACDNADAVARRQYRDEAKVIEGLRSRIIEVSNKEQPYDIFISYKDTDDNGERTLDSVLAQDIYTALTDKGYRVFFSRISLEDKLGTEYEPYIFAALNSAKVMLVVGTDYDYFNAVWVKNEWSRFLALIASGQKKTLIPVFKDIDAYDMPKEFRKLSAQDMGKVGAMQDLLRGVDKLMGRDKKPEPVKETVVVQQSSGANATVTSLLERAFLFMEDSKWDDANSYCERVLDIEPKNGEAYLGKLMVELSCNTRTALAGLKKPFDASDNYRKALRFGSDALKAELEAANQSAREAQQALQAAEEERKRREQEAAEERKRQEQKAAEERKRQLQKAAEEKKRKKEAAIKRARIALGLEPDPDQAEKLAAEKARHEAKVNELKSALTAAEKEAEPLLSQARQKKEQKENEEGSRFKAETQTLETQESELNRELSTLGLFAGKRKKELREALELLEKKKEAASGRHEQALKMIEGEFNVSCAQLSAQADAVTADLEAEDEKHRGAMSSLSKRRGFGRYPVEKGGAPVPIEWLILDATEASALIISKHALDCQPYNRTYTNVTWETCTLRKWLNSDFINTAFSSGEQAMIRTGTVSAGKNPKCSTSPGNATQDKVFLLSITEAEKYFSSDRARQTAPTSYAIAQGAYTNSNIKTASGEAACWWWLRSPGCSQDGAASVDGGGSLSCRGGNVSSGLGAVRPALWINLDS